jgi:hypothetical protein
MARADAQAFQHDAARRASLLTPGGAPFRLPSLSRQGGAGGEDPGRYCVKTKLLRTGWKYCVLTELNDDASAT